MATIPKILSSRVMSTDEMANRGLSIEEMHLRFSNQAERHYWRIQPQLHTVALVVPMVDKDSVLLVREYAAGTHNYQLQLPKGSVEAGEDLLEAANRELKEEVGKGARVLKHVNRFTAIPSFNPQVTDIVLAQDLYDEKLKGDEPEEIEVVPWSLNNLAALVERNDCTEARSIAALYYVRELLASGKDID